MADERQEVDAELLAHIVMGDKQALTDLYVRYRVPLFQYLLHLTGDHGKAEEILQDTFLAIWHGAKRYEGRARVRAWLLGIARRRAFKGMRHLAPSLSNLDDLDEAELSAPVGDEPETALERALAREDLALALARLSPVHREVLLLTFAHQLSYQEIADVLQIPIGTVKSRLNHAKRAMRTFLGNEKGTGL